MTISFDVQPEWSGSPLVRIAALLCAEAEIFGTFIDVADPLDDAAGDEAGEPADESSDGDSDVNDSDINDSEINTIHAFLGERYQVLLALLTALESNAQARFRSPVPYRFGLGTRPAGAPLAGWTDESILPSAVLGSMFSTWLAIASSENPQEVEFNRTLRSMLWVLTQSGQSSPFDYLLDLCVHGHVSNALAAGRAGAFLLTGLAQAKSTDEIIHRLYGGSFPGNDEEWLVPYPIPEWLEPATPTHETRRVIESMLERLLRMLDEVRAAATIDEWLSRLGGLQAGLTVFRWLVKFALPDQSLALQAVVSQFDEIRADMPALLFGLSLGSFEQCVEYQTAIAVPYGAARFAEERQLIPPHAMSRPALPGWSAPSGSAAFPYLLQIVGRSEEIQYLPSGPVNRTDPAYQEDLEQRQKEVHDAIAAIAGQLAVDDDTSNARYRAFGLLARYPCCDVAHWQVGHSYYRMGEYDAAADALVRAIVLRPSQPTLWNSLALCLAAQDRPDAAAIAVSLASLLANPDESDATGDAPG
jgi:tetratricopeptide (TPR) repeat protein